MKQKITLFVTTSLFVISGLLATIGMYHQRVSAVAQPRAVAGSATPSPAPTTTPTPTVTPTPKPGDEPLPTPTIAKT